MSILWIKCSVIEATTLQYTGKERLRGEVGVPRVNG